jgi:DNA-directed RNA polymerase specialized sigma24 family protein
MRIPVMILRSFGRTGSRGMAPTVAADEKARLRGFAMLVALGDQQAARSAWRSALEAANRRRGPLDHPAGWLRRRIMRRLDHGLWAHVERRLPAASEELEVERRATLRSFGASDAVISGLRALSVPERAAVIGQEIEHLDPAEVGELLGRQDAARERFVSRAVRRYVRGAEAVLAEEPWARRQATGDIAQRVTAAADRAAGLDEVSA